MNVSLVRPGNFLRKRQQAGRTLPRGGTSRGSVTASPAHVFRIFGSLLIRLAGAMPLWCAAALILGMVWGIQARAESSAGAFEAANRLYEQGKFAEAATAYEKMLQSGQASAALYFNLGNAFFKASQMGRAIAAYRRAEQMSPRDPDLRANLQFARNQVQGPTLSLTWWERGLGKLNLNEWTWVAVAALWFWLITLTLRQWRPGWQRQLRTPTIGLGIATVFLCGCCAAALYEDQHSPEAIVVAREAVVRQGPLDEAQTAFTVRDGSELRVLDRKDEWLQVSTDARRSGWVRRDQVLLTPGA